MSKNWMDRPAVKPKPDLKLPLEPKPKIEKKERKEKVPPYIREGIEFLIKRVKVQYQNCKAFAQNLLIKQIEDWLNE